ncbi:hypothetical protein OAO55_01735 [Bacteroidales bacterium]|nr:hypothetical protein [Bacteroidales bacterium]
MKKMMFRCTLFIIMFILAPSSVLACVIDFNVSDKYQKEMYIPGEVIVIEVQVMLDHRDCSIGIGNTKFNASGCKIVGATKWNQAKPNIYTRKLQVKMTSDMAKAEVICKRICEKDGGFGKIELQKEE